MSGRLLRCMGEIGNGVTVGCSYVYGLSARRRWPLALMKSANRIPINVARSRRFDPVGFSDPRYDRFVITSQHPCTFV